MVAISTSWRGYYVLLSYLISFMGSFTAVTLSEQFRLSTKLKSQVWKHHGYLVLMSISIGGSAIWCMHFVGMAAQQLSVRGNVVHKDYDIGLTIVSLLSSILCIYAGLYFATLDKMYTKTEQEIVVILSECASSRNLAALQNPLMIWGLAIMYGTSKIWMGGIVSGGGILVMHYIGMYAMVMPVSMHWNWGIIVASILVACTTASAAYWILFRFLALYPRKDYLRVITAVILSLAICGTHYTGAAAASYIYQEHLDKSPTGPTIDENTAVLIAIFGSLVMNWLFMVVAMHDLRLWYNAMSSSLRVARDRVATMTCDPDHLLRRSINVASHFSINDRRVTPDQSNTDDEEKGNGSTRKRLNLLENSEIDDEYHEDDDYVSPRQDSSVRR